MTSKTLGLDIERPPLPDSELEHRSPLRKRLGRAVRRLRTMLYDATAGRNASSITHVVICGFPRSGTTLLQLIVESCVENVHIFGKECRALSAAHCVRTDQPFLMSKLPTDVFRVDEIREYYARRDSQVRFVLSLRDPRDVLTSWHARRPEREYYLEIDRWLPLYEHFCYASQFPDTMVVRYEDVVAVPQEVEKQLREFIGWKWKRPIESFHEAVPEKFETVPLNGLRPMDNTRSGRWKDPKHRDRIRQILREIPELPQHLIELGYETDTSWVDEYEDGV